jgi:hypothetical protein
LGKWYIKSIIAIKKFVFIPEGLCIKILVIRIRKKMSIDDHEAYEARKAQPRIT